MEVLGNTAMKKKKKSLESKNARESLVQWMEPNFFLHHYQLTYCQKYSEIENCKSPVTASTKYYLVRKYFFLL